MDPQTLQRRCDKLASILEVARTLAVERDLDTLLGIVLRAGARVAEADRCTLFLLDRDRGELWTRLALGVDSSQELRTPLGVGIAGHVARTGEAIHIPDAYQDPRFNRSIDQLTGYRTRNLLTVPMKMSGGDDVGQVTGVIQVLNRLDGQPFNAEDQELLEGLGGQAAAAIENAVLHQEIQQLFEGFVRASVWAIEARDPSTAGHSERVAKLTIGLAQQLEHAKQGSHAGQRFNTTQLQELRYAALLHDFGKVGVRESVLVKAEKLYPEELAALQARFRFIHRTLQLQSAQRQLRIRKESTQAEDSEREQSRLEAGLSELAALQTFVQSCNRPNLLAEGGYERLQEILQLRFEDLDGSPQSYLTPTEVSRLSIPRGSLSDDERREIEQHVAHTYRFLSQIPWTRQLRRVPEIAHGHHEKLDGRGYPRQLAPDQIGIETRMMTIADIYDALTASDRPYKRAVPHARALAILEDEARRGAIDAELLALFIEAKVPEASLGGG